MAQVETVTLYFIADRNPTSEDVTRAAGIPGIVRFRNVREDDGQVEDADQVTAGDGVTIPSQYANQTDYPRVSPEAPLSILIVPDAPSIDLSAAEPLRLRAMAKWGDGTQTDVTEACTWGSATPGVATVSNSTNTKGNVAPAGVGTSVITATYPYAAPGVTGAVYAAGTVTFSGVPAADGNVVAGDITYTFKATPAATGSATAVQVKIGATPAESAVNLLNAINAQSGKGTRFSSDAPVNAKVRAKLRADNPLIIDLQADEIGTGGNSHALTKTATNVAVSAATLTGGANATTGIADTATVTVVA